MNDAIYIAHYNTRREAEESAARFQQPDKIVEIERERLGRGFTLTISLPARPEATLRYDARLSQIKERLAEIHDRIKIHEQEFKARGGTNWGYVTEVAEWSRLLGQVLGYDE